MSELNSQLEPRPYRSLPRLAEVHRFASQVRRTNGEAPDDDRKRRLGDRQREAARLIQAIYAGIVLRRR